MLSWVGWHFLLGLAVELHIFAGYTGSKNQIRNRQKIKLIKLDFLNLIFQKSSADL